MKTRRTIKLLICLLTVVMLLSMLPIAAVAQRRVTVNFRGNGGTPALTPRSINEGANIANPPDVTRDGWILVGWYTRQTGGELWDFDDGFYSATTNLFARWERDNGGGGSSGNWDFTVIFDGNGGTPRETTRRVVDGRTVSAPNVTRTGWNLIGWYDSRQGGVRWRFSDPVRDDMTLYARWERNGAGQGDFSVTFIGNGGTPATTVRWVNDGRTTSAPNVTRAGHSLVGWYTQRTGGTRWRPADPIRDDMTLYARWTTSGAGTTPPPTVLPPNVGTATITVAEAPGRTQTAFQTAAPGTVPSIRVVNPGVISLDAMRAVTTAAQGRAIRINGDTTVAAAGAGAVDVRVAINPALATQSVNLHASTSSESARNTAAIFQRHFGGVFYVVSTEQQRTFGMEVRIVARPAPNMNTNVNALYFYSYDRAANTFRNFIPTAVWLDGNGFLHFNTTMAGDIVITNTRIHR